VLVALLSSIEPVAGQVGRSRAHLDVAGQSVLERQARLALALGCERVVCVAQGLPPDLIAVQHLVEREGKRFHAIAGTRALGGLVTVADEVLALADGLLIDPALAQMHLADGRSILALPEHLAVPTGYERIDRNRAWAGALRIPAGDVERLNDLPADIDPVSALMRVAVQRGRPIVDLPAEALTDKHLALITSDDDARHASRRVVEAALEPAPWSAPAYAALDRAVRGSAADLLAKPAIAPVLGLGTGLLAAIGLAAAWYGAPVAALGSLAAAAGLARFGRGLARVGGGWLARHGDRLSLAVFDLLLLAAVLIVTPRSAWGRALFLLAMMLGLARLATAFAPRWLAELAQDRATLFAALAVAAAAGWLGATFQVLALLLLAALLLVGKEPRITRA